MEVGVQSMSMAASIAKRIAQHGGAGLIIDYGQDRLIEHSLQAIKKHNFVHPLSLPGEADLSCHVDFSALRQAHFQPPYFTHCKAQLCNACADSASECDFGNISLSVSTLL